MNMEKLMRPLFEGYRRAPPWTGRRPAELMVSVSNYAVKQKDTLSELDLNPVFVREKGK